MPLKYCRFYLLQWVIEISDKPGIEEAEPAFKVSHLLSRMLLF